MSPRTGPTLWGAKVRHDRSPNYIVVSSSVEVPSRSRVLQWLVFCEVAAGGFSSPLMMAGRQCAALFRVHLDLLPGTADEGSLVLRYVTAQQTEAAASQAVVGALRQLAEGLIVSDNEWLSAALRLRTRVATMNRPRRGSLWLRPPYDAWLSVNVDEVAPGAAVIDGSIMVHLLEQLTAVECHRAETVMSR